MKNLRVAICSLALAFVGLAPWTNASILEAEEALKELISEVNKMDLDVSRSVKKSQLTHYKTQYGDTLDDIVTDHVVKMPIRRDIVKRAIVHANPHAFKRNNPNWMYSERKLKLPNAKDIKDLIFTDEAQQRMGLGQNRDEWIRYP